MDNTTGTPLFIAQETLCYYPISTVYNSCPRYLFYALLLATCVTRWTGWVMNVFLGAAATYAGTAAIQTFVMVSSHQKPQDPGLVTIPYLPANTSLQNDFSSLITETDHVMVSPASFELDADAVLAIVVTGYLVFLPLQCWSRILTHDRARNLLFYIWHALMLAGTICALVYAGRKSKTPPQYMFCFPDLPPFSDTTNDGWQASWRTSTWNNSVWDTFSNMTRWGQLGDICFNPCFNSSQILRQPTALHSVAESGDFEVKASHGFLEKVIYSKRYIYSLITLCLILNVLLLTYRFLPYRSRIPSAQVMVIWKQRKAMWRSFKEDFIAGTTPPIDRDGNQQDLTPTTKRIRVWRRIRFIFHHQSLKKLLHLLVDVAILFGILFSMIVSPFTIIAFVIWIEIQIYNDGPEQESPSQVGQWAYPASIGLLMISAAIMELKHRIASSAELEKQMSELREQLEDLEKLKEARSGSDSIFLRSSGDQSKAN
ncbi:Integral membrane protein [Penicillium paradoxum]|uniref:Integral membrane protein n=1 Tax=Penicillium paradoxum TaxID=176176 RepID=UPI002547C3B5|nr:Integral membrane protein [Penicillium paradoxum]KAJ5773703.1 Integral membrane protein [Penicillium paradoxum]